MLKILYITNGITGSGGLERVLAVKASYLVDVLGYEVHILTLNSGHTEPFYKFSQALKFHDIKVVGSSFYQFFKYRKGVKNVIKSINPDIISVCDDGLKGLFFPILFGKSIPVIYERHVSKQIEIKEEKLSFIGKVKTSLIFKLMKIGGSQFDKFVVLTKGNLKEWQLRNLLVIPNPLPFNTKDKSELTSKKILVVGKQSYQKGYDRLLKIWALVSQKLPDWQLEVYGKLDSSLELEKMTQKLKLTDSVSFYPPIKNIQRKYKETSIYLMTSRFEGFGMVLIEAMAHGVPCISFDCPYGPSDIIKDNKNGFLIENGDIIKFANAVSFLIENKQERHRLGNKAKESVNDYELKKIALKWDILFKSLVK